MNDFGIFFETEVRDSPGKGRGVFALTDIPAQAVIEVAPVIVMTAEDRVHLDKTLLHDYIFEWLPEGQKLCCMALGQVPIYNHAMPANAEHVMDYAGKSIAIVAVNDIPAGAEIFINYNGDADDAGPVWFAQAK